MDWIFSAADLTFDWVSEQIKWFLSGVGLLIISYLKARKPKKKDDHLPPEDVALRTSYLNRILKEANILPLQGIDPKSASCDAETCLNLSAVYTALLTHSAGAEGKRDTFSPERSRLSALAALNKYQNLALLGDPGGGKSTFVNFVALCMAGKALEREDANLDLLTSPLPNDKGEDQDEKQPWEHGALLPVRVILRDFAAGGLPDTDESATADHLWQFIKKELEKAALGNYADPLYQELQKEGGILLLDGLDEVPEADSRRVQIKQIVEDFIGSFPRCRVLITSRTYAYQNQEWRIAGLPEVVLAPFTKGQIHRFIDRWYAHAAEIRGMNREDAQGRAVLLKQAIFNSRHLLELAVRPLLLTLMASLHAWRGGTLPEDREALYADAVELLLDWWETDKAIRDGSGNITMAQPSLMEWLNTDKRQIRNLLNELACNAHAEQQELRGTADIAQRDLVSGLLDISDNPNVRQKQLILYLSQRSGLLMPRGVGVYTFCHRTFQEYLAACRLTDDDYPFKVAELYRNDPERWREVALLAGAKAAAGAEFAIWALAGELCSKEPDDSDVSAGDIWGAHLAGRALAETASLDKVSSGNQKKFERARGWLLRIIKENLLPATERAIAGNSLACFGDPRFNPDQFYLPDDDELGFVNIPAGKFMMGSDKKRDKDARDNEQLHTVELSEYAMARYPVTNAQFRAFIRDSGYHPEGVWERYCKYDNHPVVGVTWDDAVAYCDWLTGKLGEQGYQGRVRLPTEAEWEKAARGTDGRIYPWGDEPDTDKANYGDTGIGMTSAVGCFPEGAGPYGILDMAGNMFEWCQDRCEGWSPVTDTYKDGVVDPVSHTGSYRVNRGGSWFIDARGCRSAFRYGLPPGDRDDYLGFRLVRSLP